MKENEVKLFKVQIIAHFSGRSYFQKPMRLTADKAKIAAEKMEDLIKKPEPFMMELDNGGILHMSKSVVKNAVFELFTKKK